jgi:hypothetical protein
MPVVPIAIIAGVAIIAGATVVAVVAVGAATVVSNFLLAREEGEFTEQ